MKVALTALLLSVAVLASPVMAGGNPSPDELVASTLKIYASLRTYSDTGVVLDQFGPKADNVYRHTFRTFFRAPRNFYFEFNADPLIGVARSMYAKTQRVTNVRRATVWIDTKSQLVRKVFEDTPEGLPGSAIMRITTTLEPQANPPLDDKVFQFEVPSNQK